VSYYPCKHKADNDHSRFENGVKIWKCSFCGTEGRWTDGWSYFGNMECKDCWAARIDDVSCSNCSEKQVQNEKREGGTRG
jgi:hypothetical protein